MHSKEEKLMDENLNRSNLLLDKNSSSTSPRQGKRVSILRKSFYKPKPLEIEEEQSPGPPSIRGTRINFATTNS